MRYFFLLWKVFRFISPVHNLMKCTITKQQSRTPGGPALAEVVVFLF